MANLRRNPDALNLDGSQAIGQILPPNLPGVCYVNSTFINTQILPKSDELKQLVRFGTAPALIQRNPPLQRGLMPITSLPVFPRGCEPNIVSFRPVVRPATTKQYEHVPMVPYFPRMPIVMQSGHSNKFPQFMGKEEQPQQTSITHDIQQLNKTVPATIRNSKSKQVLPSVSSSSYQKAVAGAMAYRSRRKKRPHIEMEATAKQEQKKKELCTEFKKRRRTSVYRGVFWSTSANAWVARMMFESKSKHLGYFDKESEAARAYDREQLACRADKVPFLNFENSPEYVMSGKSENLVTRHVKPQAEKTSEYRGVCWHKSNSAWKASILVNGRNTHIGYFADESKAAQAYDLKAIIVRKGNAKLNFPEKRTDYLKMISEKQESTKDKKRSAPQK